MENSEQAALAPTKCKAPLGMIAARGVGALRIRSESGSRSRALRVVLSQVQLSPPFAILNQRRLGHVVYAPLISVSTGLKRFTEDWALIEVNHNKIGDRFKSNVVYLGMIRPILLGRPVWLLYPGNKMSAADFVLKMHPHPEGRSTFKYPVGDLP